MIPAIFMCNRNGVPMIESQSVNVSTTAVTFDFRSHPTFGAPFTGIIAVKLSQAIPTGTTATLPIRFTTNGQNSTAVTVKGGGNLLVSGVAGTGIYLFFCDNNNNILQLL